MAEAHRVSEFNVLTGQWTEREPHPEGNPALAAAVQAILDRRLAASHGIGDDTSRRAALLLEILPDAAAAIDAAAPLIAAAERERADGLAERLKHAESALAGDSEGCRLWMLDCGALVEKHRERADGLLKDYQALVAEVVTGVTSTEHGMVTKGGLPFCYCGFSLAGGRASEVFIRHALADWSGE